MKFRITGKDLVIFVIFCIFLFYLCCIGVVNCFSFGATGKFSGLNPFLAFNGVYFPVVLILFVIALIMIFSSVSSYIFEKEKGKGLGIVVGDKEEKGYSRWSKDKEIKTDRDVVLIDSSSPTVDAAGIPLAYKDNKMWVDNGEYHTVVLGASGSGKSRCIVKPLVNILAKKGESMIITDPKGELYVSAANHLKDLGYKVVVLNFRDPAKGNAWNPLTLPYQYIKLGNMDKATELLDDVAANILYDPNNKGEPFWEKSASDFFSGLAMGLFQDANQDEININSINVMSTVGEERLGASNYTKEYFTMKGESSSAYTFASNTINAPSDTKGGILSTFRQKIRLFASRENLSEMLGHSDFDLLEIGKQKTAVFIVIHDEKTTYHALATIFIKQCYETLIDVAQEHGGKLPIRTNFILDEFANMPPLKDVDAMVTAARSRGMRFTFIIQNFAQLNDVYGKEVAEVIRGNCGNVVYLITTELAALEEISKMCGEVKSKDKDKTASTPLVTVSDLQKLKFGEAIILRMRKHPFKTKLPMNDKMNWGYKIVDADFPVRETHPVQLFDIKTFVKEKKKEKMLNNVEGNPNGLTNMSGANPFGFGAGMGDAGLFGNMGGANPFAGNQNVPSSPSPLGGGIDLDAMMRDIDKKIAELDAEEAKQKEVKKASASDLLQENSLPKLEDVLPAKKDIEEKPINTVDLFKEEEVKPVKVDVKPKEVTNTNNHKVNIDQTSFNFELPSLTNVDTKVKSEEVVKEDNNKEEVLSHVNPNNTLESVEKPKINVDVDSVIINNNVISDDEFFDDFFGDDDN